MGCIVVSTGRPAKPYLLAAVFILTNSYQRFYQIKMQFFYFKDISSLIPYTPNRMSGYFIFDIHTNVGIVVLQAAVPGKDS